RLRVDGDIVDVNEVPPLDKNKNHTLEVVVDRLVVKTGIETRLADSIETGLELAEGNITVNVIDGEDLKFSENHACPI
ncbi:hypothetical protein, partial [Staphylococcus haemolyticus]